VKTLLLAVLILAACDTKPKPSSRPIDAAAAKPPDATPKPATKIDPAASLEIVSEEIEFAFGAVTLHGTITRPADASAPRPGVLLLAGSGPTDRDWNSKLLAGTNGSGKQLAEALAKHGAVTLRFDKAGAGVNPGLPPEQTTFDLFRDESIAALTALRARADVDPARVFVAGNSEGGVHTTRIALAEPGKVAGLIYLASASRSMLDTMMTQVGGNLRDNAKMPEDEIARRIAQMRAVVDDFLAGKPADATKASDDIPELQQMTAALIAPISAPFMREYLVFDNAHEAEALDAKLPILICQGGKDIQIDPELDARRLKDGLEKTGHDVSFQLSPDANHVFKHEVMTMTELRENMPKALVTYTADGVELDADFLATLLHWLQLHT
jgi:hypothetical protein